MTASGRHAGVHEEVGVGLGSRKLRCGHHDEGREDGLVCAEPLAADDRAAVIRLGLGTQQ
jgi:hypothetical protein